MKRVTHQEWKRRQPWRTAMLFVVLLAACAMPPNRSARMSGPTPCAADSMSTVMPPSAADSLSLATGHPPSDDVTCSTARAAFHHDQEGASSMAHGGHWMRIGMTAVMVVMMGVMMWAMR